MNDRRWTFEGLPFRMLLEQAGRDRLPFPLQFTPHADSAADYHRQRQEATDSVAPIMDADLRVAVHTIIEPRVRVEVVGHVRVGQSAHEKLRAHAAIGFDSAAVLTQHPGVHDRSGADVTVHLMEPFRSVGAVLSVLPEVGRGTSTRIDVDRPVRPTDHESSSPLLSSTPRTTDDARYQRLFSRAPSSAGEILVCAGPAPDSRLTEGTSAVQWVDFADDGRYMIRHSANISVVPVSAAELASEIQELVEKVALRA